MNFLFFLESCISGLLAGLISWLLYRGGNPWDLLGNFQISLMASSIFCGMFSGLVSSTQILVMERKVKKATNYFLSSFIVCFSITALGSVVYSLIMESVINNGTQLSTSVLRFFWWLLLAIELSCGFGFLHNSLKVLCKTLMGFTPAFIIAGALVDKTFLLDNNYLLSFLFLGLIIGLSFAIAWELLKEGWLDEYRGYGITFRYYLEGEFSAGSSDECDLTLQDGPETLFIIVERDSVHIFELQVNEFRASVNGSKFRYRALVDGDKINVGERAFIYHSTYSRIKEEMPETTF